VVLLTTGSFGVGHALALDDERPTVVSVGRVVRAPGVPDVVAGTRSGS
jgi:hypothetical protein